MKFYSTLVLTNKISLMAYGLFGSVHSSVKNFMLKFLYRVGSRFHLHIAQNFSCEIIPPKRISWLIVWNICWPSKLRFCSHETCCVWFKAVKNMHWLIIRVYEMTFFFANWERHLRFNLKQGLMWGSWSSVNQVLCLKFDGFQRVIFFIERLSLFPLHLRSNGTFLETEAFTFRWRQWNWNSFYQSFQPFQWIIKIVTDNGNFASL